MADVDRTGVGDEAWRHPACNHEADVIHAWERDIVRAARFRARNRGNPEATADELAQAARLRLWGVLRKPEAVPSTHYLRKVIANAVRTPLARDLALDAASEIEEADAVDVCLEQSDPLAVDAVRDWLVTLPAPMQRVYRLLFVEGYSQREAALILGVSQPRIAHLHRALIGRGQTDLSRLAA